MERISCGIIQDLLPSYHEGLTGDHVAQMIQEHLNECPQCRGRYEEHKRQQEMAENEEISRGESFGDKLKGIRYYIIGILIGLVAPVAFIIIWFALGALGSYLETMMYSYFL